MVLCEFCDHDFSTKGTLLSHQVKAKYCLEIQKKTNKIQDKFVSYDCQFCSKSFTYKKLKNNHELICKTKYNSVNDANKSLENENVILKMKMEFISEENEKKIRSLEVENEKKIRSLEVENEKKIRQLELEKKILEIKVESVQKEIYEKLHTKVENCVEKIALQPKTSTSSSSNTNILNNMPCFTTTVEELKLEAQKSFSEELFLQGQAGAAKFFLDYSKNKNGGVVPWVVTDKSRGTLKLKNANNEIVTDSKAIMLSKLVSDSIKEKNLEYYDTTYMVSDNKDYEDEDTNDSDDDGYKETENDIRDEKIQNGYMEIKRMTRDNTIFRKKLIEGS